jgi:hypothetical protein
MARRSITHINELGDGPHLGIVLDDTTLGEEGDFDGKDTRLPAERTLYGL